MRVRARDRSRWRVGRRRMLFRPNTPYLLLVLLELGTAPELGLIALAVALPLGLYHLTVLVIALLTMPFVGLFELLGLRRRKVVVYSLEAPPKNLPRPFWSYRVGSAEEGRRVSAWLRHHLENGADWFRDDVPEPMPRPLPASGARSRGR